MAAKPSAKRVEKPGPPSASRDPFLVRELLPAAALLLLTGVLLYGHTLKVPFYLDDTRALLDNTTLRDLGSAFGHLFGQRGLTNLTFALNYRMSGWSLAPLHLVNLVLHAGCGLLAWLLLRRLLGPGRWLPLLGALLFVAHPLQTEGVTYLVQRATVLSAFLFMLAVLFYLRAREARIAGVGRTAPARLCPLGGAVLAGALAVLAKENAASLPLLLLVYEGLFPCPGERRWREAVSDIWPFFVVPLLVGLTVLVLPLLRGETLALYLAPGEQRNDALHYLVTQFTVIWNYLRLLVFPWNQALIHDYPLAKQLLSGWSLLGLVGLLALGWLAWRLRRTLPLVALGISWFFLGLAVESSFIPLDPMFEHRVYLPLFGFLLALLGGLSALLPPPRVAIVCGVALLACLPLTWQRNALWTEPLAFYLDNFRVVAGRLGADPQPSPGRLILHDNLGLLYLERGQFDEAITHFGQAVAMYPNHVEGRNNLGLALTRKRQLDEAITEFRLVLQADPRHSRAHNNLGVALVGKGRLEEAIAEFRTALDIAPDVPGGRKNLELALALAQQQKAAVP